MQFFLTTLLVFILSISQAFACSCAGPTNESSVKTLERAAYVLYGEVTHSTTENSKGRIKVKPFFFLHNETKKKSLEISYFLDPGQARCGLSKIDIGEIRPFIIYQKNDGTLELGGMCDGLNFQTWTDLKKEASGKKHKRHKKQGCLKVGGIWHEKACHFMYDEIDCIQAGAEWFNVRGYPYCFSLTSDFKKSCKKNKHCQGYCVEYPNNAITIDSVNPLTDTKVLGCSKHGNPFYCSPTGTSYICEE